MVKERKAENNGTVSGALITLNLRLIGQAIAADIKVKA